MQAANTFMKKRRAGVAEPAGGLEAYFIPPGTLSDAMLQVPCGGWSLLAAST